MKIKKIKKFQYTLLKLNLIKHQVYKRKVQKSEFDDVLNNKTETIELHLKRALQIIHKYHINKKKIIFIGVPQSFQKKFSNVLKNTKHIAIPKSIWVNGILSNRSAIFRHLYLKRQKNIEKMQNTTTTIYLLMSIIKPNLIVVFNKDFEKNALNETYKLKLPIITLNTNLFSDTKSSYKVPGNFQAIYKKTHHAVFLILTSVLKKNSKTFSPKKQKYKNISPKKQYFWSRKTILKLCYIQKNIDINHYINNLFV